MSPMNGTEHYVSRKDGGVYYYKVGQGDPLVFIHDAGSGGWNWGKLIDRFAEHFTCYNIDLPGFDHSDIPPRQYSVDDFTQAIVDVLDSASITQTNCVGNHTGALLSLNLAATQPQRVRKIVLDGLPYWNKERGQIIWEKWWIPRFTDTTSYDVPVLPMIPWEEAVKANPNTDHGVWEKREEIKRKSRRWMRLTEDSNCNFDAEAIGPKVQTPTLLIYGEGDVLRRGEQRAKEAIKGCTHVVVEGSTGAGAHGDKPEEFTKLALDFLLDRH